MRKALSITLVLVVCITAGAFAKPVDQTGSLENFEFMNMDRQLDVNPNSGVFSTAIVGTTFFGGTFWAADSSRWEAIQDSCWTFDTGVGSHFDHSAVGVNPFKDPSLHAYMEGWVGIDNSFSTLTFFRRTEDVTVPLCGALTGSFSLFAGVYNSEAEAFCYSALGSGYGDNWFICVENTSFSYDGVGGNVTWSYDYSVDVEPGFDYVYALVDTSGADDDVLVVTYTGPSSGTANVSLTPGTDMRSDAGAFHLKYCIASDGAYSDQDGFYPTDCPFLVDQISVSGGGNSYGPAGFETTSDGWGLSPAQAGAGGEWSSLRGLGSLPPTLTSCTCTVSDTVLVFSDLTLTPEGHGLFQDNLAASPWIDLLNAGVQAPGKFIQFEGYFELPLLNYIFVQTNVQFYPQVCVASGKLITSGFISDGFIRYFGGVPTCTNPGGLPTRINFGTFAPAATEQMRIALGVLSYCRFFGNCTGITNSTPWFDNAKLGLFGDENAPLIGTTTIDQPQDAFPENGTINIGAPGRLDSNNVKGQSSPEAGSSLADTLIVNGATGGAEVWVEFGIVRGPGVDNAKIDAWLAPLNTTSVRNGIQFYEAQLDTAEQGGGLINDTWMGAYIEGSAGFSGTDTDTDPNDLDPSGQQSRLANDIFRDNLMSPGTRVNMFYKTRFTGGTSWFVIPGNGSIFGTDSAAVSGMYEWECLPSSMDSDTTFNCVLYVDHFDGRGAQPFVEAGLDVALGPGGGNNYEGTGWDRWDVEAPSSQQASLGRPVGSEYGANSSQLLGYTSIVWNSGNLGAFNLVQEDANVLIPWLTYNPSGNAANHGFYGSGDGLAESMTLESSEPNATVFLNTYMGATLTCETFRDAAGGAATGAQQCGNISAIDATVCPDLDPLAGANLTAQMALRSVQHQAQGNGCPQERSFDIVTAVGITAFGTSVDEEEYVGGVKSATGSSVSAAATTGGGAGDFRTVLDGLSVHYRRDPSDCTFAAAPQTAVNERVVEVLSWFGLPSGFCNDPNLVNDVPTPQLPRFTTALLNFAPNPLLSGSGRIQFTMSRDGDATVQIFDVGGRLVKEVFNGLASEGLNTVHWDGTDASGRSVSSGVYFYRFVTEGDQYAKKIAVVRNGN